MSCGNRLALFGMAALVLLVAAIVTASSGGDDEQPAASSSQPTATASATAEAGAPPQKTPKPKPTPEPPLRVVFKNGAPQGGVRTLEVDKGERVRFVVTSDIEDGVHVHGYDIEKEVGPGTPAKFDFKATIDGILEIELENAGIEILSLRVNP